MGANFQRHHRPPNRPSSLHTPTVLLAFKLHSATCPCPAQQSSPNPFPHHEKSATPAAPVHARLRDPLHRRGIHHVDHPALHYRGHYAQGTARTKLTQKRLKLRALRAGGPASW